MLLGRSRTSKKRDKKSHAMNVRLICWKTFIHCHSVVCWNIGNPIAISYSLNVSQYNNIHSTPPGASHSLKSSPSPTFPILPFIL